MADEPQRPGLGTDPKSDWPKITSKMKGQTPIERLTPGSDLHGTVLGYLNDRITLSENRMSQFYDRWRVNETKYQAYINVTDYEALIKQANEDGASPKALNITVPYSFATINTIVTYLVHTFAGRKPIFQVTNASKGSVNAARNMEQVLQYNADHTRMVRHFFQFLMDTQLYGVGIIRTKWCNDKQVRTFYKEEQKKIFGIATPQVQQVKVREEKLVYSGNEVDTIDPFMFLPDPRVPMSRVNRDGEFVFWRDYTGKHKLKQMEYAGEFKYVDAGGDMKDDNMRTGADSARNLLSKGQANPGRDSSLWEKNKNFSSLIQGTIMIIPNEVGLGSGEKEDDRPQRWLFAILNKKQIIQARRFDTDHNMHPVCVSEPYGMGYGFGQAGMADYLAPMQDLMSWFINSHVDNVRTSLNNMWLVDPSKVEIQDLMKPGPGKIIRLKRAAYGQDIRGFVQQFQVQDVTGGHVKDFQMLMQLTDAMSSITDNLRGLQDDGGRKTATEVRTAGEAGASRLAAQTRLISAQAMVDLSEQMCLNVQQFLDPEFYLEIVGPSGAADPIQIKPEMLVGDFNFPIHDGTLPLDRVAMLDVWKQIFQGVAADQELRQRFDVVQMFKFIAELGGARNIDQFMLNVVPDEQAMEMGAKGALPMGNLPPAPGLPPNPGDRLAGAP